MISFLQSKYWKECKKNLGNEVYEVGEYFFHTTKIPYIGKKIGYIPRPDLNKLDLNLLLQKAKEANCVYVTIDPLNLKSEISDTLSTLKTKNSELTITPGDPIHLQENVIIDLSRPEEQMMEELDMKYRYNVRLALKKGIEVKIDNSEESFEIFMKLYDETVIRQGYHGRSEKYIRTVWNTLKKFEKEEGKQFQLIATAYYQGEPLASSYLFLHEDTVYYPYGGSKDAHRNLKPTYALMWEIMLWGNRNGYKFFDFWGIKKRSNHSSSNNNTIQNTNPNHTIADVKNESESSQESVENLQSNYEGFSKFKLGFGGQIIEYADTVNLIIDSSTYSLMKVLLNLRKKILFKK